MIDTINSQIDTLILNDSNLNDTIVILHSYIEPVVNENSNLFSNLFTTIITIIVALIAAFIALYQVRSNSIANARIRWNEELREMISTYNSQSLSICSALSTLIRKSEHAISNVKNAQSPKEKEQIIIDILEFIREQNIDVNKKMNSLNKLNSKLALFLNLEEKEHLIVKEKIKEISDYIDKNSDIILKNAIIYAQEGRSIKEETSKLFDDVSNKTEELNILVAKVLKIEWKKSKHLFWKWYIK